MEHERADTFGIPLLGDTDTSTKNHKSNERKQPWSAFRPPPACTGMTAWKNPWAEKAGQPRGVVPTQTQRTRTWKKPDSGNPSFCTQVKLSFINRVSPPTDSAFAKSARLHRWAFPSGSPTVNWGR